VARTVQTRRSLAQAIERQEEQQNFNAINRELRNLLRKTS
jgi:hypothetical protein